MQSTKRMWIGTALKTAAAAVGAAIALLMVLGAVGGPLRVVALEGASMEPTLHADDMLIVRNTGDYRAGDVVAYRSEHLNGAVVAHRVVRVDGGRLVLQGDNNDWLDPETPARADVLGERWLRIPRVGVLIRALGTPAGWAAAGALMIGMWLAGRLRRRRNRNHRGTTTEPPPSRVASIGPGGRDLLVSALVVGAVASVALGALSFLRSGTGTSSTEHPYRHTGRYEYGATVPAGAAYQDGRVETGDALFRELLDRVDVAFAYRLDTELPVDVRGTGRLAARIEDGAGWQYTMELASATSFEGTEARLKGALDLDRIGEAIEGMQRATGAAPPLYTVELLPEIEVEGVVGRQPFQETFAPALAFSLDSVRLWLAPPESAAGGEDPLAPEQAGSVEINGFEPRRVSLGPLHMGVRAARLSAAIGGVVSLLGLVIVYAVTRSRAGRAGELGRIRSRYGRMIVSVRSSEFDAVGETVETDSMESLVGIAERHGRVVLHERHPDADVFLVRDDGMTYRYRIAATAEAEDRPSGAAGRGGETVGSNGRSRTGADHA